MDDREKLRRWKEFAIEHEQDDYLWLVEQAERVQALEKIRDTCVPQVAKLKDKVERCEQVLKFYADERNYVIWNSMVISKTEIERDEGEKARQALEGEE